MQKTNKTLISCLRLALFAFGTKYRVAAPNARTVSHSELAPELYFSIWEADPMQQWWWWCAAARNGMRFAAIQSKENMSFCRCCVAVEKCIHCHPWIMSSSIGVRRQRTATVPRNVVVMLGPMGSSQKVAVCWNTSWEESVSLLKIPIRPRHPNLLLA